MVAASKQFQKRKLDGAAKHVKPSKKTFKSNKMMKDDGVRSEAVALQLEDEIPDFPRGGNISLSRKEREKIRAEVDVEFDVDEHVSKKTKRGKVKKKNPADADDLGSLFGGGISGKLPRYANKITNKNISRGMKLWGVVAEVNEKDLIISLPGGLRGLVRAKEALDFSDYEIKDDEGNHLRAIFNVGQLVPCIVLQLDDDKKETGKRKIWLSMRLSLLHKGFSLDSIQDGMVLSANVKSIEDHGYILHFGLPSISGFLPKRSQDGSREIEAKIGQLMQCVVTKVDRDLKNVRLCCDPDAVAKCATKDLRGMSIDLLMPGMMVNARVQSVLENGIMLAFLTYFTGTVDLFHLQNPLCNKNWKDEYNQHKKVNARILFIDPSTRAVGLTLNPHLVRNKPPPLHVASGGIFDQAKVVRIDRGSGLLLEIPSTPVSSPAYVSASDVAEDEVKNLEKKFKEGSCVRVRILGLKQLEGIAIGTLKTSAFEGPAFIHSDVKPGMVMKGKIISVDTFGAIVQFPGGLKAMCPLRHMSEFEIAKPRKKFKVGAELTFRALGCKSKRITVTHKKTLVKSKLPILTSYADATEGLVTHGWITKIEKHGCFVRFYNGVHGFAPRFELGLDPGSDPDSVFHVGEVVKCRVTSAVHASRRINLSFEIKPASVSEDDSIKLGSIVSGVVDTIAPHAVIVCVKSKGYLKGTISIEHLADHHEHAKLMKSVVRPGYEFKKLLVLDIEGKNLVLSSKHSLLKSAEEIPSNASQLQPNSVIHGYICNLIESGCFIRFLGRLTGFAPRSKAMDETKGGLSEAFYIGQSVRANIIDINQEEGRITLSLKQSSCSSVDASFIQEYFLMDEKIANLQSSDTIGTEFGWVEQFTIGSLVKGTAQEKNDLGVVVKFENFDDVLGCVPHYHLGGAAVECGSVLQAVVLDFSRAERLVDLSLRSDFTTNSAKEASSIQLKKKRKRGISKELELHQRVNAVVEMVKEHYLVLSIPEYDYTIGYASVSDYNTQNFPTRRFSTGQSVVASVVALPNPLSSGRLLLLLDSVTEASETSRSKKAKKKSNYEVGSVIRAEITEIKPLELRVNFGSDLQGRIHITEVNDINTCEEPFANFKVGQSLSARIVAKPCRSNTKRGYLWELSIKPALLRDSGDLNDMQINEQLDFSAGQSVSGYVYKVDVEWVWLAVSRNVKARLYILDTTCEPHELKEFQRRFHPGKAVSGYVLSYNKEKKSLRLVQRPVLDASQCTVENGSGKLDALGSNIHGEDASLYIYEGDILGGRISKILPGVGGLVVQIGPHTYGKVHFTELKDSWVSDPLDDYCEGQFVKCKVIEISHSVKGTLHIDLSLRTSLDGMGSGQDSEALNNIDSACRRIERIDDLSPDMVVQGYVKNIMAKGCFIVLSRKLEAKILLSNLSDEFVEKPEKEFPIGKPVIGRVLTVEPLTKRIEVSLKSANAGRARKSEVYDFTKFSIGDRISGRIKRVEPYGLFIVLDQTNMVGLCHKSELSDERVDNIQATYKAGERVTVKILKLDQEKHHISLGMKSSYFASDDDDKMQPASSEMPGKASMQCDDISDTDSEASAEIREEITIENGTSMVLSQVESRASVPPLEVDLDEIEQYDFAVDQSKVQQEEEDKKDEKNKRRAKKKAKEEREKEIQAAEERLLEKSVPASADDFEKLVRSSPSSSFIWIKYMAFTLSLADVEKARSIAERALRTINIREEEEKLNVWVAYFNLENEHGNPPQDAVKKVFERALQYCDQKKVYLALLGMYDRTEQNELADELLDKKMIKKFKHSCKVWLRKVQQLLKGNGEGIQSLVTRALECLPRHKHIKFISQTAIREFKCGVPDRGRSLFEGVLREYPKRTDLWSVYLDQEIRLGDVDVTRSLFERAISLSLPPKKMKFLFKKYLEYEKSLGDDERAEDVKRKAMEYVESTLA
ncbi:PREDICTED: rRNA biogenesis protein RRP5 isoform X2 [Tarenaya hassleriana]|uniref:rRNA biogenesis protein RRP5 isoform X2 n=1 Tax=Tarenaya hassleriana TaxID=28532 RepID=UPI00053C75E8|nr:PREDICTED: rRNA biogenesis protein RRP5 isoform X2 [Tarenaya hassleriana]